MGQLPFVKYQGAGNDFIIIDHLAGVRLTDTSPAHIARLCDRRFGIGADGLMLLEPDVNADFRMRYFNADGHASTMCGNGGRCIAAYAHRLGYVGAQATFVAVDGPHRANITAPDWVELEMNAPGGIAPVLDGVFLDTGSPHFVKFVDAIDAVDVNQAGAAYRHHPAFAPSGTNANFISGGMEGLHIATFERGVEAETLACGTGVTAAVLVAVQAAGTVGNFDTPVVAKGGQLRVRGHFDGVRFSDIWLCGPAVWVFEGRVSPA